MAYTMDMSKIEDITDIVEDHNGCLMNMWSTAWSLLVNVRNQGEYHALQETTES